VLPLGWSAVGSIHALEGTARWLDGSRSLSPMTEHLMSGPSGPERERPWRCGWSSRWPSACGGFCAARFAERNLDLRGGPPDERARPTRLGWAA
jgi:hypothetical protein